MNVIDCRPPEVSIIVGEGVDAAACLSWVVWCSGSVLPGQPFSECETLAFSSFMLICEKD